VWSFVDLVALVVLFLLKHGPTMRACGVAFGHETVTDLTGEHLFTIAADDFGLAVLGATKHHRDEQLMPLQGELCSNGMLEGLAQCLRGVQHTAVVRVGDRHGR
jgi:hypothetical protein